MFLLSKYFKVALFILLNSFNFNDALSEKQLKEVNLQFYYGPLLTDKINYDLENSVQLINHSNFDKSRKIVFYIYDYKDKLTSDTTKTLIQAYLKRNDHNIIVFDWSKLDAGNFLFTTPDALEASFHCGNAITRLIKESLNLNTLYIVGFGLGAHMAVPISKTVTQSTGLKIKRITGLDPTLAAFYDNSLNEPLSAKHAEFVDIIHTDAGIMGQGISSGSIDFWPNNGNSLQPGCLHKINEPYSDNDLCSHRRAVYYWAESVSSPTPDRFLAIQSIDWENFKENTNSRTTATEMGLNCPLESGRDFYLQTNPISPFARGIHGIQYFNISESS